MSGQRHHLLLVSQRPVDYGGGGSIRWRHLLTALPRFGWDVSTVTARAIHRLGRAEDPGWPDWRSSGLG